MNTAANNTPAARHKARHFAVQGVYQWQLNQTEPDEIYREFCDDNDMRYVDLEYFQLLLQRVTAEAPQLDANFSDHLQGHGLDELDPVTLAVLRIANFELQHRIDIPFKVVISEAVGLAKKFGAADSHKFINAVLDKVAVNCRKVEVDAEARTR